MNNPYAPSDFTANNPFAPSPQSKYPDLNASPPVDPAAAQFTQWLQPGAQGPAGFQQQQQQQSPFQQQQQPFQQQQMSPQFSAGYGGAIPQQGGFQPTSSFGQQMASQVSGSSYGYLQGQLNMGSPSAAYNPVQQQLQSPGYAAQFDPYASIGQGWDGSAPVQQQQQQQQQQQLQQQPSSLMSPMSPGGATSPSAAPTSTSPTGQLHPREYIRVHKTEVEAWDAYAWKQLLGSFDGLKDAWEARRQDILKNANQLLQQLQYGGANYYPGQLQGEISRLQGLAKEAESNHDSVAASSFQMHEVFTSYRQSADVASKRRVREASNAALTGLPDWPPLAY